LEGEMTRSNADLPVLIGQTGPLNGQRWSIDGITMIGRDASCNIVIPDRQVSRFHARLTPRQDGTLFEDLGSKNGSFHKGTKVEDPILLSDGDMIQIALVQSFVYLSSDATMPMESSKTSTRQKPGRLYLDGRSRRVWIGNVEIVPPLSASQFRFLQMLYEQQGKVVSRAELVSVVWGDEEAEGVSEQALDALVRRLRDRLNSIDPSHPYVVTVRGHGLRLDNPSE
jgi:pSer/pThr/pTyr-binding forkhead associated (FHA) protein